MRLKNGELAPNFKTTDTQNRVFSLAEERKKPILLAFFRYASCPLCNLRVHQLIQNQEILEQKLEIVLVFQSPLDKIEKYVGKQDVPYRIIADPKRKLYRLYGVENSWLGFLKAWTIKIPKVFSAVIGHRYLPGSMEGEIHRIPADFIIGKNGTILRAYYGKDIGDHLALKEIVNLL